MSNNNEISNGARRIPLVALIIGILPIAASLLGAFIFRSLYEGASLRTAWKIFVTCELALVAAGLALLAVAALKSRKSNMLLTVITFVTIAALLVFILLQALRNFSALTFIFCGMITAVAAAVFIIVSRSKTERMRKLVAIAFCSLLINTVIGSILRGGAGIPYSILIGSVLYLLFTSFSLRQYAAQLGRNSILIAILTGWALIIVPSYIVGFFTNDFPALLFSYPDGLCHVLSILAGFAWYRARARWVGWSACCATLALAVFMFAKGFAMWLDVLNFGGVGKSEVAHSNLSFVSERRDTLSVEDWRGKAAIAVSFS